MADQLGSKLAASSREARAAARRSSGQRAEATTVTSPTSGNRAAGGFNPHRRVDVHAIPLEETPLEWQPTLRLIAQLVEIFPDQIIDIAELPSIDSPEEESK